MKWWPMRGKQSGKRLTSSPSITPCLGAALRMQQDLLIPLGRAGHTVLLCLSLPAALLSQCGPCIPILVAPMHWSPMSSSCPLPCPGFVSEPAWSPPGPGTHPQASSFLRQMQQQQSRESRRMSSSARSAPAPITPIRWLASARQNRWLSPIQPRAPPVPILCPSCAHPGSHPCGRRPSAGRRHHRGTCRLQRSWLHSGRAGT